MVNIKVFSCLLGGNIHLFPALIIDGRKIVQLFLSGKLSVFQTFYVVPCRYQPLLTYFLKGQNIFLPFKIQENVFNICQYRQIYFLATATIPDAAQKACLVGRHQLPASRRLCSYSSDSDAWEESIFFSDSQTSDSEFRTQIMQICCAVPSIQNIACFSELLKEVCIHQSRARIRVGNGNDGQIAEMYSYKMSSTSSWFSFISRRSILTCITCITYVAGK